MSIAKTANPSRHSPKAGWLRFLHERCRSRSPARGILVGAAGASRAEIVIWTVVVLAATILPGLGIVIAAVLAFKRLRHNPFARWVLLGVSIVATVMFVTITT